MASPRVSVIIPTYNRARSVCRAVDSVLAQTYRDFEIVVVDDGSTDDTRDKLGAYGSAVTYLYQENQGASAARNTGLGAARGELVNFLDSDDRFVPDKLAVQVAYLDAHGDTDAVLCRWRLHWVATGAVTEGGAAVPGDDVASAILLSGIKGLFPPHAPLVRRRCLDAVGGFDTTLPMREEQDLWLRLGLAGCRFGHVDPILCEYELSPSGKGRERGLKLEKTVETILDKVFSNPNTPAHILALRDEATAVAWIFAALYYLEQDPIQWDFVQERLVLAFGTTTGRSPIDREVFTPLAEAACRIAPDDPRGAVDLMFAGLPLPERRVAGDVLGQAYLVAAHEAYRRGAYSRVVRHLARGSFNVLAQLNRPGTLGRAFRFAGRLPRALITGKW